MRLFLGKFSNKYPEQIEKRYYAAGKKESSWYGGVQSGDYVFVSYEGKIVALWRAKEYTELDEIKNFTDKGVLLFDEIKKYDDVSVANDFTRYKYFVHDLNLVNKVSKSVKGLGFIPIKTSENCPRPEDINLKLNNISIYIALKDVELDFNEGDIRVLIDSINETKILSIEKFKNGIFEVYDELNDLYEKRNAQDGKFTIRELSEYALEDQATLKRKFLVTLLDELESKGYMKISSAIKLYDNLLVGRKRTANSKVDKTVSVYEEYIEDEDLEEETNQYFSYAGLLNFNPNLILYGPPGTGKTYSTKKIIDHFEKKYFNQESSYKKAEKEKRVKAITFHQSYSYEEFIEGIRPLLGEESEGIGYKIENGIFKELCINAEKELIKNKNNAKYIDMINTGSSIWKVSLGERKSDEVYNECILEEDIAIGWLDNQDLSNLTYKDILYELENESGIEHKQTQNASTINSLVNEMAVGDIVLIYDGPQTIRMIGIIKSDYKYETKFGFKHRRSVEWIKDLKYPVNIYKYNGYKNLTLKTIYELTRMSISDVIEIITENSISEKRYEDKCEIRPYYIIIDEINRGNISKIFGELITLIEQDKRGKFKSLLPYSKKDFSVPSNLFIIGTMNTADRSIAAIDTALRRRFTFVEIEPDSSVISRYDNHIINDCIDLTKLLDTINENITSIYDRDHRIGHAYFMGIESLSNFYQVWYYKIIPLLNEYFYNDVSTLKSIIGKNFYDDYGNIKYLSLDRKNSRLSEFEENILKIYRDSKDE